MLGCPGKVDVMRVIFTALTIALLSFSLRAEDIPSEHAQKTLDIYTRIVGIESSKNLGNVQKLASFLADEFKLAGFPSPDVEVLPVAGTAALVVTYQGDDSSGKAPILLLGHMDVVEADANDWERPPFELTRDDTYFYGRGTRDNKFGVAQLASTFIRLKKEGYVPNRDLILVFAGDEESTPAHSTLMLINEREDITSAEFALNTDAGSGILNAAGDAVVYRIQAAEKTYVTWEITARNPGGHSSRPKLDNAIYDLAVAISRIQNYRFPVRWSEMTLAYFEQTGRQLGGELGETMIRFAHDPEDKTATDRLFSEPSYVGSTRTTCVVTMLRAGHAENALPQAATATVNCRIYPGIAVADIKKELKRVIDNDAIEFEQLGPVIESSPSELRPDVMAAMNKAVHSHYPNVNLIGYMAASATDGVYFRAAGIPTLGIGSVFMNPAENFAHGLNERVPIKAFYDALDHWSIIIKELAGD
jgi:acetylornithine deacetylase/succinyl-diaminopimelate desuccinylase-like protein